MRAVHKLEGTQGRRSGAFGERVGGRSRPPSRLRLGYALLLGGAVSIVMWIGVVLAAIQAVALLTRLFG